MAECPNACSQPQIKDVGIIGALQPAISDEKCIECGECAAICPDNAISIENSVFIDFTRCMACGKCINVCPTGTLAKGNRGYRVLLGGKLGRHPRLARELPGIFSAPAVIEILEACLDIYKKKSRGGKRFAEILTDADFLSLADRFT